jgi:hypothetical protein
VRQLNRLPLGSGTTGMVNHTPETQPRHIATIYQRHIRRLVDDMVVYPISDKARSLGPQVVRECNATPSTRWCRRMALVARAVERLVQSVRLWSCALRAGCGENALCCTSGRIRSSGRCYSPLHNTWWQGPKSTMPHRARGGAEGWQRSLSTRDHR